LPGSPFRELSTVVSQNRWLVALRQLCCHPQVGSGNKLVLGNVLKTVEDVLTSMREKAISAVQSDQRALLQARVQRAQYICYDAEDCERFETAIGLFQGALEDLKPVIADVIVAIREAWKLRQDRCVDPEAKVLVLGS
jgi:hypothetical protein